MGSRLKYGDEVGFVVAAPVVEALAALDNNKWGEYIAVRGFAVPVGVVLDQESCGHRRLKLRVQVQRPFPRERLLVQVELDGCLLKVNLMYATQSHWLSCKRLLTSRACLRHYVREHDLYP